MRINWRTVKVKEIAELGRGRVISEEYAQMHRGSYPVYSSQTTNNGEFARIATYDFEGEYVTWTTDGANAGSVYYRNGKFNCTNVCGTLKFHEGIDPQFVAYLLGTLAKRHVSYVGNPKLMNNVMAEIEVTIPVNFEEQKRIAEILSAVDEQIAIETKLAEKYEKTKSSLVSKLLFNKQLDGTNKKGVFADLVDLVKDKYTPNLSDHDTRCVNLEDIPEARGKVMSWSNASANQSTKTKFLAQDILFGKLRPYLRKYAKPDFGGVCTSEILAFRAKECVHPEYVYQIVGSSEFVNYSSSFSYGTKMPRTEWGVISNLSLMIPPLHRQQEIAAILGAIDEKIELHKTTVEKLNKVKTSLMDDLLAGKTRVPG